MARIRKILIANRGEIALRVMRTCHEMGIETVAVFSDADEGAQHARFADQAVRIGPAQSALSYLDQSALLRAAELTGADAVHPGYGFLSENAAFAKAVRDAGLIFIGPSPEAIQSMGSKRESKRIVKDAGVPVIPGYDGQDQSVDVLAAQAVEVGFPALIKASAGGGGRGMRVVRSEEGLAEMIESARREAESAFGDGTLLIERYIERPRHIEIQILGDSHGSVVHLFERECSVQRRHQKIIEESPSVAVSDSLREEMGHAAVTIAKAIGYENAGTVEFILAPDGAFYFLEVNTRLQVEHPVTEMVTGLDLVRAQIEVAQGAPLGFAQEDLCMTGAAVECRIYAEDPDQDFLPCSGTLDTWFFDPDVCIRVDGAVESGSEISVFYDPLLAKLISHGANRVEATDRMIAALKGLSAHGIKTNRDFLIRVLEHPDYHAGNIDTHFVAQHASQLAPVYDEGLTQRARIAVVLSGLMRRRAARDLLPKLVSGFRNNRFCESEIHFETEDGSSRVQYRDLSNGRVRIWVDEEDFGAVRVHEFDGSLISWEDADGVIWKQRVFGDGQTFNVRTKAGVVSVRERPVFPEKGDSEGGGGLEAPIPGRVVALHVSAGDAVKQGQELVVLEAMKMEHSICAPRDGVVESVLIEPGALVDSGQELVSLVDEPE